MSRQSPPAPSPFRVHAWPKIMRQSGSLWALVILIIVASFASSKFLTIGNIINLARSISSLGLLALGMTFVILTGGIDISVPSTVSLVSVVAGMMLAAGIPIPLVIIGGILAGGLVGLINGLGIVRGNIFPFIMTMGTMTAIKGLTLLISGGAPVRIPVAYKPFNWLGGGLLLGIPVPVYLFALLFAVSFVLLKYTRFGRSIYCVGDNREAARLTGINTVNTEISAYVIIGLMAGLSALTITSKLMVGDPTAGTGMELDAIAMVVIGGTSSLGGQGGVTGTLVGAGIIVILSNILNLLGVSPFLQQIFQGVIIIVAVLIDRKRSK